MEEDRDTVRLGRFSGRSCGNWRDLHMSASVVNEDNRCVFMVLLKKHLHLE